MEEVSKKIRSEHRESVWKFPFVMYSPEIEEGKVPLIVQLHGAGERGDGQEELGLVDVHGFSKYIASITSKCIVVMPHCPKNSFWAAHEESILAFIDQIKSQFSVDENCVYLTGMSKGGFGT